MLAPISIANLFTVQSGDVIERGDPNAEISSLKDRNRTSLQCIPHNLLFPDMITYKTSVKH